MFDWLNNLLQGGNNNSFGSLGGSSPMNPIATPQAGAPMSINPTSYNPQGGPYAGAPGPVSYNGQMPTTPGTPPNNPGAGNPQLGIANQGGQNQAATQMAMRLLQPPVQQVNFPQWLR